jgi:uncharacterized protein (TIGR03083 family)
MDTSHEQAQHTGKHMDATTMWGHIHRERRALAEALSGLPLDDWQRDTLCPGWSVLDIAAHVISNPQITARHMPGMVGRNLGRSYDAMIFREVKRWSRDQTPERVLADFDTYDGSLRHVPVTTRVEPMLDVLVHTQDILRPLGLRHDTPVDAAMVAADRARLIGRLTGWRRGAVRLVATDADWARGRGPEVRGPMQELLLVCTGRARVATDLTGDGVALLPR